ncbi:restriction endonuclease [Kitasatospora sp. NPDC088783]|uniref:restriction endonuclease n=1 Tax=Kitasatospora sp. NPDC088783 TaxID=3364077 RepID=UPI0037FF457C
MLKRIVGVVVALAVAKVVWQWLRTTFWRWITLDVWGWIAAHPWWCSLAAAPLVAAAGFALHRVLAPHLYMYSGGGGYPAYDDAEDEDEEELFGPVYRMRHLDVMHPTEFEKACAALLARDGFTRVVHSGGSRDLGADVVAYDTDGRKVVVQCKHYARPVGSRDVQMFNGTARPVHHADVPVMVGLNGFTADAQALGDHQDLALMGRQALKRWAHGTHLYDALGAGSDEDCTAA